MLYSQKRNQKRCDAITIFYNTHCQFFNIIMLTIHFSSNCSIWTIYKIIITLFLHNLPWFSDSGLVITTFDIMIYMVSSFFSICFIMKPLSWSPLLSQKYSALIPCQFITESLLEL